MATDFIITITLSAADAGVTLILVVVLGAVFLKGFREAIASPPRWSQSTWR